MMKCQCGGRFYIDKTGITCKECGHVIGESKENSRQDDDGYVPGRRNPRADPGPRNGLVGYRLGSDEISKSIGNRLMRKGYVAIGGRITELVEKAWHTWNQEQSR